MDTIDRYKKFKHLLHNDEKDLPEGVKKTIDFFNSHKLWFNLSRNVSALSCKDAAQKRYRLGHIGIPLEHELKSYFGKFTNASGSKQYAVLHCKGHQQLDFDKVKLALNAKSDIKRLSEKELFKLSSNYGLVNPFSVDPLFLETPILHVFDISLEENNISPYTMMTNAGDFTWAVEFKANQLVKSVHHFWIEDITVKYPSNQEEDFQTQHKIGILTGNSPESGILLWRRVSQKIREILGNKFYGDISLPRIIVESIPDMGLSMELDLRKEKTWDAVRAGVSSLCRQGATIICITCNTTQYFTPEIRLITSEYGAQFISIAEVTRDYLEEKRITEFLLLGTKYVACLDEDWSAFSDLKKYNPIPIEENELIRIQELAFKVKQVGISSTPINIFRDLECTSKSNNIVVALTEISLLLDSLKNRSKKGKNYIDTLELLAEAVAKEYLKLTVKQQDEDTHLESSA